MTPKCCLALLLLITIPTLSIGTTAQDLRSRFHIDGDPSEFTGDEWIVDPFTAFPERAGDSRWGSDNDISAIALSWDNFNLYIAVSAVAVAGDVVLFLDTSCDGLSHLSDAATFRRNIQFQMTANFLLQASRGGPDPEAGFVDCSSALKRLDSGRFAAVFFQDAADGGALEVAIPWEVLGRYVRTGGGLALPAAGQTLSVLAAVTAGLGSGAGDAVPDPSVLLENDSTKVAVLNNHVIIPLDSDDDGILDVGVSPRSVVTVATAAGQQRQVLPLRVELEKKIISPEEGKPLRFRPFLSPPDYTAPVYVTARVFSAGGHLVRNLFLREPRNLSAGGAPWDEWDGRDDRGAIVPGGVYILAVSGGPVGSGAGSTVKASFAVVR
ncbi:MAG: hypothetical protein V3V49_11180 [Candidatus Krumholzibacteria bacterium]